MKSRLLVFSTLFLLASGASYAQQDKLVTHFIFDKMSINPGATGIDDGFCGTTIYRNQWDRVNGAPNSAILNVQGALDRWAPVGVGISFYHDAIGFSRQNSVTLNGSYKLSTSWGTLGIGVGLGILNVGMNPDWVAPVTNNDPSLPTGFADTKFDMNAGLYWKGAGDYYVGASATHLTVPVLGDSSGLNPAGFPATVTYNSARHYYLMGGKKFVDLFNPGWHLDVNVLLRTDMVKLSSDINARFMYEDLAYGGLTFRTSDAIALMAGARPFKLVNPGTPMDNLLIGYSYDITINKLAGVSRGSHEMMVKYCYYLPPVPIQKSKHPRWL
ncbi:MAG: PorP/SprF family type IX secretion system membrane protein [Crocinitomicaceae bacterium]|nr:PorP/SprF family type IX secretion system membrane protein [Crocinitomicaceae bacterium]